MIYHLISIPNPTELVYSICVSVIELRFIMFDCFEFAVHCVRVCVCMYVYVETNERLGKLYRETHAKYAVYVSENNVGNQTSGQRVHPVHPLAPPSRQTRTQTEPPISGFIFNFFFHSAPPFFLLFSINAGHGSRDRQDRGIIGHAVAFSHLYTRRVYVDIRAVNTNNRPILFRGGWGIPRNWFLSVVGFPVLLFPPFSDTGWK